MGAKRNYKTNLRFVEAAFGACWRNAQDLVTGAKLLLDNGLHAQGLSLSVLALEELGKLFCIDGLLFASTSDHKAENFAKSLRNHATKLSAFELFPGFLARIATVDPRAGKDKRFAKALAFAIQDLRSRGNDLFAMLPDGSLQELDQLKQQGLYARPREDDFVTPAIAVDPEIAKAVHGLAWRASTTLDFLFKGGTLANYIEMARSIRAKLTEADHQGIEGTSQSLYEALFPEENGRAS